MSAPRITALLLSALTLLGAARAIAQPEPRAEARERFQRGLELYDEGRFDGALAEFARAYELAPAPAVLFNLGRVHARLGHPVESTDAFERYLAEGGASLPADQRAAAERELAIQRARIALLTVETNIPGAMVTVDGTTVGRTPLTSPLRVAAGDRLVSVGAPGYETEPRRVTLAGGVHETVRFELRETGSLRGSVRVVATLPGVEVLVDGVSVGTTPLERSVSIAPGAHVIRATRLGYVPFERQVQVDIGVESEVSVTLARDPNAPTSALGQLRFTLPLGAALFVDGAEVPATDRLELPAGPHRLRVEASERVPVDVDVEVDAGATRDVELPLRWTPDARHSRLSAAGAQRTASTALTIVGSLLLAGGAAMVIASEIRVSELELDQRRALFERCRVGDGIFPIACYRTLFPWGIDEANIERDERYLADARAEFNGDVDEVNILRAIGWTAAALGAVSTLISVIVLVSTPSDEDVERSAQSAELELRVSPGGLALTGRF